MRSRCAVASVPVYLYTLYEPDSFEELTIRTRSVVAIMRLLIVVAPTFASMTTVAFSAVEGVSPGTLMPLASWLAPGEFATVTTR